MCLKEKNKKSKLILYKNKGKFYNAYESDAYMINLLFNYKVIENRKSGFPDSVLNKVIETLNENKISYQIVYTDKDPVIKEFGDENTYNEYLKKAIDKLNTKEKIDRKIVREFKLDNVNIITLSNLNIDNIIKYDNNKYYSYYKKIILIRLLKARLKLI